LASIQVRVRPCSSTAASASGVASARRSTSSQRLPPSTFGMCSDPRRFDLTTRQTLVTRQAAREGHGRRTNHEVQIEMLTAGVRGRS